jgi:hypothetical protein
VFCAPESAVADAQRGEERIAFNTRAQARDKIRAPIYARHRHCERSEAILRRYTIMS